MDSRAELERRVEKLEGRHHWVASAGAPTLVALAIVVLLGAASQEAAPTVIEARALQVVDENGTIRIGMNADGLSYYDQTGTKRAGISAANISYLDESGTMRSLLFDDGIAYIDADGTRRAVMHDGGFVYMDANWNVRARVGPRGQIVLRAQDGTETWRAPR